MSYLIYILLIVVFIINIKVYYWVSISKQGFKSETPEGFLKHPNLYVAVSIIIFLLILIFNEIAWYIIMILYFLSIFIGGMLAGKKYKEIIRNIGEEKENKINI